MSVPGPTLEELIFKKLPTGEKDASGTQGSRGSSSVQQIREVVLNPAGSDSAEDYATSEGSETSGESQNECFGDEGVPRDDVNPRDIGQSGVKFNEEEAGEEGDSSSENSEAEVDSEGGEGSESDDSEADGPEDSEVDGETENGSDDDDEEMEGGSDDNEERVASGSEEGEESEIQPEFCGRSNNTGAVGVKRKGRKGL